MSADKGIKDDDCGCASGACCGGGKPAGRSQKVRFISFAVIVAAAAFLIVRGMNKGANCAPEACGKAASKGCCPASK